MIPPLIVRRARELGLGIIAITDHNTAENVAAVQKAAAGSDLVVLPGMEVQTREEVHIICIYDTLEQVIAWQETVYAHLPDRPNVPEVFGAQFVVDETGDLLRHNERLLLTSTSLSLEETVAGVIELGGLAIAAHVDRPSYSVLANLGFVPEGLPLDALELSVHADREALSRRYPELDRWPLVVSGDAHRLSEMRAGTRFWMGDRSTQEMRRALCRAWGCQIELTRL